MTPVWIIWCVSILIALGILIFYAKDTRYRVILLVCAIVLTLNTYLSNKDPIDDYKTELDAYSYVEKNGAAIMTIVTALCLLVLALFSNKDLLNRVRLPSTFFMNFAITLICCVLIILIIWMPNHSGHSIRFLRDIKTVFLTYSITFFLFSVVDFYDATTHLVRFVGK
jgi:hypothetical protein